MPTDTHAHTKQVRLPIRTHIRLGYIAFSLGLTAATVADDMVEEYVGRRPRLATKVNEAVKGLPSPRRGLPAWDARNPLDEEDPPANRQSRLPIRTYAALVALAQEWEVSYSTALDRIMDDYMARHGLTADVESRTEHLPPPPYTVPRRGEITPATLSGEIVGVAAQ